MNLYEFLNLDHPETFDMKLDYAGGAMEKYRDPIERFLLYKASAQTNSAYLEGAAFSDAVRRDFPDLVHFDCDRCGLMKQVYKALWGKAVAQPECSGLSGESGDTMTSFQTLLNLAVERMEAERAFSLRRLGLTSQYYCTALYAADREGLPERLNAYPGLGEFAAAVHTLGDFLPVPPGFNVARAGYPERDGDLSNWHDYWDLTLTLIREWYRAPAADKPTVLRKLLHGEDDTAATVRWLEYFETWERFVEENYLQDFVDNHGVPIPFCNGHSWDSPVPSDLGTLFRTAAELILRRGQRMVRALRETQRQGLLFGVIRRYLSIVDPISVCMRETSEYENYETVGEAPHSLDSLYLYGIGSIRSEFPGEKGLELRQCIEIVLSKEPRKLLSE